MAAAETGLREAVGPANLFVGDGASGYAVDGIAPRYAVFPATVDELSRCLAVATAENLSVVPWGGGTAMALGGVPSRVDLVVGLCRLNRVVEYVPADLTISVQAGITLSTLQHTLHPYRQLLPVEAPSPERATIGGCVAVSTHGPLRTRYGAVRDLLLGTQVVHADGTVTRGGGKVVKNVTGYDMPKLYAGSLGTLGIITEASFRLFPAPRAEATWCIRCLSAAHAVDTALDILASSVVPNRVELLGGDARQALSPILGQPAQGGVLLAVSIGGVPDGVEQQGRRLETLPGVRGQIMGRLEEELHNRFWRAVIDLPLTLWKAAGGRALGLKVSCLPSDGAKLVSIVENVASQYRLSYTLVGGVGHGVLHVVLAGVNREVAGRVLDGVRQGATALGGACVVERVDPALKPGLDIWGPVANMDLMAGLKGAFDPKGILNPGRFVGGL